MTSVDTSTFAEARQREHELNSRQRQILDLLLTGKTNGEIADSLGMTLDGAKWNVSEILTKLGLATREEAAEYWRWRRGGLRRLGGWMRGLATPFLGKVALGAGATGLAGIAAIGLLQSPGTDSANDPAPLRPFYLEATIHGAARDITRGLESSGTLRWWFEDADHQRFEMHDSGIDPTGETSVTIVADGLQLHIGMTGPGALQQRASDVYTSMALPRIPDGLVTRPWMVHTRLGPWPVAVRDLAELEAHLAFTSGQDVLRIGDEVLNGRPTTKRQVLFGNPASTWNTFWIDTETLMILRIESSTDEGVYETLEVTGFEWDVAHDPAVFTFIAPPGWREAEPGSSAQFLLQQHTAMHWSSGAPGLPPLPAGFYEADPAGMDEVGSRTSVRPEGEVHLTTTYAGPAGTLSVSQAHQPLRNIGVGYEQAVRDGPGRLNSDEGGLTMAWWEDGTWVQLRSPDLTYDEMTEIAERMTRK